MNQRSYQDLLERYRSKDTSELIDLLKQKEGAEEDEEFQAVRHCLETRSSRFPDMDKLPTPTAKRKDVRFLGVESDASVCTLETKETQVPKIEMSFPKGSVLRCEESRFKDQQELVSYLSETLGLPGTGDSGLRLSMKRKGKYQRLDRRGQQTFTFGDPILDIITDEYGWVSIGKETYHFLPLALASSQDRGGGITSIDLGRISEEILRQEVREAISGNVTHTLIEYNDDRIIIASTNPSEQIFLDPSGGSARMKFRSWKKNWGVYQSIGTEIETWGGDFEYASIHSQYSDPVVPSDPFICGIVKDDSDSDTSDDYVDEYEYAWNASVPSTVRSHCEARWKGRSYSGDVSRGDCVVFV
jgi:hypothetical protein